MYIYDMCVCDLHSVVLAGLELCRSGWPQTQGSALQSSVTLPHVDVDAAISQDIIALHLGPLLCNEHQTAPTPKSFFWLYDKDLIFNAYLLFVK